MKKKKCCKFLISDTLLFEVIHLLGQNSRVDTQQKLLLLFSFRSPSFPAPDLPPTTALYRCLYKTHICVCFPAVSMATSRSRLFQAGGSHTLFLQPFAHLTYLPSAEAKKRHRERERKIVPQKNNRINSGCNPTRTSSKPLQSSRRRPAALLHYALCVRPQLV